MSILWLASEAAWVYAWSVALGAALGDGLGPALNAAALGGALLAAAIGARLVGGRAGRAIAARCAVALLGLAVALAAGHAALPPSVRGLPADEGWRVLIASDSGLRASSTAGVALFVWWRGIVVGRGSPSLAATESEFRLGVVAFVALLAVVALSGRAASATATTLTAPALVFVFVGLLAMPLARIAEVAERSHHGDGMQLTPSGPWLGLMLGVISGLLVTTLVVASVLTPDRLGELLAAAGAVVGAALRVLAYLLILPAVWLLALLALALRGLISAPTLPAPTPVPDDSALLERLREMAGAESSSAPGLMEAQLALVVAGLILVVALLARALLRRASEERGEEVEEVRDLIWERPKLGAMLASLLTRLRRRGPGDSAPEPLSEAADHLADARQLYRELLRLAARTGRGRVGAETPLEYEARLGGGEGIAPREELRVLTDGCVRTRYGPVGLWPTDLAKLRAALERLRAAWRAGAPES